MHMRGGEHIKAVLKTTVSPTSPFILHRHEEQTYGDIVSYWFVYGFVSLFFASLITVAGVLR
jgi:hypothetical protein